MELRSSFLERSSLRSLPDKIRSRHSALNTYGTNAIEGNTLTLEEVRTVVELGQTVPGRPVRDLMETVQHEQAFRGLLGRLDRPIDLVCILELHEQVFRGVLPDAGQWRRVNVTITGAKNRPPRMEEVVPLMEQWCKDLDQRDREGEDTIALAARSHTSFVSIHPFSDGNGRVGRLLLNLFLMKRNWPPVTVLPRHRDRYLNSLQAGIEGDDEQLRSLLEILLCSSILELLDDVGTEKDRLVPLKDMEEFSGKSAKYLTLRAAQGELPAVISKKGYRSSARAWELYRKYVAYR